MHEEGQSGRLGKNTVVEWPERAVERREFEKVQIRERHS